jgi:TatD DNase family protein
MLKAMKKDVELILNVGTNSKSIKDTLKLIEQYDYMYGIVGYFPSDTIELLANEKQRFLESVIKHNKVVGIGEIGLDYHWNTPSHELQEKFFRYQLEQQ